jgi:hypothetical protein
MKAGSGPEGVAAGMMRPVILILVLCSVFALPLQGKERQAFDPLLAYGDRIEFEVRRDDTPIGRRQIDFHRRDDGVQVDVVLHLKVTFLGLTVYRFGYQSGNSWRNGRLSGLTAITNDDGDQKRVEAVKAGGMMTVTGLFGEMTAPAGLYPTDHWNPGVRNSQTVINTIAGELADVRITASGGERVEVGDGSRLATRYVYSGGLHDVEVWYDGKGRRVRLRFPDRSGGVIDYHCIRCGTDGMVRR